MSIRSHVPLLFLAFGSVCSSACAGARQPSGFDQEGSSTSSGSSASSSSTSGGSSGSGSGGYGSSSGGGTGSSGGSSSGTASGSGGGSSSSGSASSGGDGGCSAKIANGAVPLTSVYLAAGVLGDGGYAYAYADGMGSAACVDTTAFCGAGTTAVATPTGSVWGAGIGVSLNQAMATSAASPPVAQYAVTGGGISYSLSELPVQGLRLAIDEGAQDYCAPLTAATGTVKWASFNTKCWDDSGLALAGAPKTATYVHFQVPAVTAKGPFDFCVTAVNFAP